MSEENVEIIRRGFDAFQSGDMSALMESVDENVVGSRVAPLPDVKTYRGRDGAIQMLLDWVEGFDEFEMAAEEFIDVSDSQVVVRVHQRAVGSCSGAPIGADFWFGYTLIEGKIVRMYIYGRQEQALKAAGLSE